MESGQTLAVPQLPCGWSQCTMKVCLESWILFGFRPLDNR